MTRSCSIRHERGVPISRNHRWSRTSSRLPFREVLGEVERPRAESRYRRGRDWLTQFPIRARWSAVISRPVIGSRATRRGFKGQDRKGDTRREEKKNTRAKFRLARIQRLKAATGSLDRISRRIACRSYKDLRFTRIYFLSGKLRSLR